MEQNITDKIKLLEDRIVKVVKVVKQQREENNALQEKISELDDQIKAKDDDIQQFRMKEKESERMKQDMASMIEERSAVHTQVEELLKELDSIEVG